jgi:hypothetical protein
MDTNEDCDVFSSCTNESKNTIVNNAAVANNSNINEAQAKIQVLNELVTATSLQMCAYLQCALIISCIVSTLRLRKSSNKWKRKRRPNIHRDRNYVISFIHSWSDEMFRRQFRITHSDFTLLEATILENMEGKGYDSSRHACYAARSSGSPISLELRLYVMLRILSGASYLDMIWYGVEIRSVPGLFWRTICDIDDALDKLDFLLMKKEFSKWWIIGQQSKRMDL